MVPHFFFLLFTEKDSSWVPHLETEHPHLPEFWPHQSPGYLWHDYLSRVENESQSLVYLLIIIIFLWNESENDGSYTNLGSGNEIGNPMPPLNCDYHSYY